ncbi:MAG: hypothetical protein GVY04_04855 [Cyanobacteria bacterium]|jgi:ABC-type transporter Mla MlaB component|nr:hypothetical protein [Cyanobacteria bacterium GSL.Bin1]
MTSASVLKMTQQTLSLEEEQERRYLERKVERAFYEAGKSLAQLRDRGLYRSTHSSFEQYCRDRFGFQRRHSYQLIDAAKTVDNLIQLLGVEDGCAPMDHILPTKERQVRPLTSLTPQEQKEAWMSAIANADGNAPSSRQVSEAVQVIQKRTIEATEPSPHKIGEVCKIKAKNNPDLRAVNGYAGIIREVYNYSCSVETHMGELTINNQNLESLNDDQAENEQAEQLLKRLWRLREVEQLDHAAVALLNSLEKQHSPQLNPLQEALLQTVESYYSYQESNLI